MSLDTEKQHQLHELLRSKLRRADRLQKMRALLGDDGVVALLQGAAEKWGTDLAIDRFRLPLLATRALLAGKPYTEPERLTCGAKTRRTGAPCKRRPVPGKKRCPNHGGLNRSDRTPQGRINAGKGLREWHAARRAAKAAQSR
jgi:hypothetical protein